MPHRGAETEIAEQLMRGAMDELEALRSRVQRDASESRALREQVRERIAEIERRARQHVNEFTPVNVGRALQTDLRNAFRSNLPEGLPQNAVLPITLDEARREWTDLERTTSGEVDALIAAKSAWEAKVFKRSAGQPRVSPELWAATIRLDQLHGVLPALREQYVSEQLDGTARFHSDLATEIERRGQGVDAAFREARETFAELEAAGGRAAAGWNDHRWDDTSAPKALERLVRVGELFPQLPSAAGIERVPVLLRHPLGNGIAIGTGVDQRQAGIDLVRALALRTLAANPAGAARFAFVDPVSLGQSVSEFRHLAEFDERLVGSKTWTSEREIETCLDELAAHLEVVISTYLRGQFETIEEYNEQAGEVAEAARVLVVLDYPTGFTNRSARQLLSLIENGPRCGVHVILHHDPSRGSFDDVPLDRLTHSM